MVNKQKLTQTVDMLFADATTNLLRVSQTSSEILWPADPGMLKKLYKDFSHLPSTVIKLTITPLDASVNLFTKQQLPLFQPLTLQQSSRPHKVLLLPLKLLTRHRNTHKK